MEIKKNTDLTEEELAQVRKAMEDFCNTPISPVIKQEDVVIPKTPERVEVKPVKKRKAWIALVAALVAVVLILGIGHGYWMGLPQNHPDSMAKKKQTVSVSSGLVAIMGDGTVSSYANNWTVEASKWKDMEYISMSANHAAGVCKDGTVVFGGYEDYGEGCAQWTDIVAVATGGTHTIGLRKDGTVVAAGKNTYGQCDVSEWKGIIGIATNSCFTAGLRFDGRVVITEILPLPDSLTYIPGMSIEELKAKRLELISALEAVQSWRNIIAISVGEYYILGLRKDGTVAAAGLNILGQCDVEDWKDISSIDAGNVLSMGVAKDGRIFTAGRISQFTVGEEITDETLNNLTQQMDVVAAYSDTSGKPYILCADGKLCVLTYFMLSGLGGGNLHFQTIYENVKLP